MIRFADLLKIDAAGLVGGENVYTKCRIGL